MWRGGRLLDARIEGLLVRQDRQKNIMITCSYVDIAGRQACLAEAGEVHKSGRPASAASTGSFMPPGG